MIPTEPEMQEFEKLHNEFKGCAEGSIPKIGGCAKTMLSTCGDELKDKEEFKKLLEKMARYDRYIQLRIVVAPFLYEYYINAKKQEPVEVKIDVTGTSVFSSLVLLFGSFVW